MSEKRVFRLKDGYWSIWVADSDGTVVEMLTDLTLGSEVAPPPLEGQQQAALEAVLQPWKSGKELNMFLKLEFKIGPPLQLWTMHHQIVKEGKTMQQLTDYVPKNSKVESNKRGGGDECGGRVVGWGNACTMLRNSLILV